ncbi:MAG: T9SS type A sorting domain-containing protein [Calditrichaeota bacterium]|nr:T9SS type A sorting domain-containing protein [Calditrichota bacterium]
MRTYKTNSIGSTFSTLMILIVVLLINISAAIAQSETKINADNPWRFAYFGYSVSISGDYAVVGAYSKYSGSAYIFIREGDNWNQQAELIADDAAEGNQFGVSVSISGDYAVIGDRSNDDDDTGSAYIFVRDGTDWTQQAKLTADDAEEGDWFGYSVSISGDYSIIGAVYDDDSGSSSGSAYIFARDGVDWTQQAKLTADDAASGEVFGYSVSISDDYAVIGASGLTSRDSGSAYIFVQNGDGWTQQAKLTADDAAVEDRFGCSVSISGDYAIVGASQDDDGGGSSGSAYIFVRDGEDWTQQAKLTVDDAEAGDRFGYSVSISGDNAVIGALFGHNGVEYAGSAYIFVIEGDDWTQQVKLTTDDATREDAFGRSVSISGDYAIVGVPFAGGDIGPSEGSAYIYNQFENGIEWRGDLADFPGEFFISEAYPNPFNSTTTITYGLPGPGGVSLQLYNLSGQLINTLFEGNRQAGIYSANLVGKNLASGLYFVRLEGAGQVVARKIMLIR